jgi:hypothetical protein
MSSGGSDKTYTAVWLWQPVAARARRINGAATPSGWFDVRRHHRETKTKTKRRTEGPPFVEDFLVVECPGGAKPHPGFEGYFFFAFLAFFTFFAFFAFLAISSSLGLMEGNATRGMLGDGYGVATASMTIPTDSQATASHSRVNVIALSTVVVRSERFFVPAMRWQPPFFARVGARLRLTMRQFGPRTLHRSGAGVVILRRAFFTNSKPRCGFYGRSESPLSDIAAISNLKKQKKRSRRGFVVGDKGGGIMRVLGSRC